MLVGIPIFQDRIAPRLDCASQMLLLQIENGQVQTKRYVNLVWQNPLLTVNQIREMGVELIICGAVPCFLARMFMYHGIRLIPWVRGEWQEVLGAFLEGKLASTHPWVCPGRHRHGWKKGKGRRR